MAFDWIVPHIKCRVVICPHTVQSVDERTRWFHKRSVTIDSLDSVWDNDGGIVSVALVRSDNRQLWAEYEWLRPLTASSGCICPEKRLWNQGCKCGGV